VNPEEFEFSEEDYKLYLALQQAGKVIPVDIKEALEDIEEVIELPDSLKDTDRALERILSAEYLRGEGVIRFEPASFEQALPNVDRRLAARNGGEISKETLDKLKELREKSEQE
jgi:hypothetical protein